MFAAPFDVILPTKNKDFMDSDRVVQPDIVVVCDPEKIKERGCFGTPDWIIEILSPNTTKKDLQDKFDLYEESGVSEYWIAEPRNQTVEVFVLDQGTYKRIRTYVKEDEVASHTLKGLTISLDEVFE
jgi:Uma2 family endonuclease